MYFMTEVAVQSAVLLSDHALWSDLLVPVPLLPLVLQVGDPHTLEVYASASNVFHALPGSVPQLQSAARRPSAAASRTTCDDPTCM